MSTVPLLDEGITTRSTDLAAQDAARFAAAPLLACDIETSGLNWRTDRIATVQIYAPGFPVAIIRANGKPPHRLLELLAEPRIPKVFHHAMFDLRFLAHQWNAATANVRCTKIAAKLLHPTEPQKQSLQPLVAAYLGITVDKSEQLSNWEARRLSRKQLRYAATDVAILPSLYAALHDALVARNLWSLAAACFDHIPTRVALELGGFGDVFTY